MAKFKESELILQSDGSIYHLHLHPDQIAETVIVVGDPERVETVSKYFDKVEYKISNREIVTHTGTYNGMRISVMSTGIGPDNIDIVMNELDALVNIDLDKRMIKEKKTSLNIVRLGTSGALQADIPVNSFVLSTYGNGLDGLLYYYEGFEKVVYSDLTNAFIKHSNWPENLPKPYVVKSSSKLISILEKGMIKGITATSPGFYGPQGRVLRLGLAYPNVNEALHSFKFQGHRITNFEMETAPLYGLCRMMGHHAATACVILANRITGDFSSDYKKSIDKLIVDVLNKLTT